VTDSSSEIRELIAKTQSGELIWTVGVPPSDWLATLPDGSAVVATRDGILTKGKGSGYCLGRAPELSAILQQKWPLNTV